MADILRPSPQAKSESPEAVAFELMELIFFHEVTKPTRDGILSTYTDCLKAARGEYVSNGQDHIGIVAAALSA